MGPPMVPVLVYLGLSYAAFCAFVAALQGVVMARLGAALPSPSPGKGTGYATRTASDVTIPHPQLATPMQV